MTAVRARPEPHRRSACDDPYLMAAVRLRRVSRWLAQDMREDLADLYTESCETTPGGKYPSHRRAGFLHRLAADIRQPGFALVIAETECLVGCAFGFPVRSDGRWWCGFEGPLPFDVERQIRLAPKSARLPEMKSQRRGLTSPPERNRRLPGAGSRAPGAAPSQP